MLDFSDRTRTGICILTSAADYFSMLFLYYFHQLLLLDDKEWFQTEVFTDDLCISEKFALEMYRLSVG